MEGGDGGAMEKWGWLKGGRGSRGRCWKGGSASDLMNGQIYQVVMVKGRDVIWAKVHIY